MAKQDDWLRITLRIPPDLHENLVGNLRGQSLNADIVARLWQSLEFNFFGEVLQQSARITLDAGGRPIAWMEINQHVTALCEAFPHPIVNLSIEVLTPEIIKKYKRLEDAQESTFEGIERDRQSGGTE